MQVKANYEEDIMTAYLSSAQNCASGTVTVINLQKLLSVGNELSVNNGKIVCGKDGYVEISGLVSLSNLSSNGNTQIRVYLNTTLVINVTTRSYSTLLQGFALPTKFIEVHEGDKLSLQIGAWSGDVNATGSPEHTYITVEYV